MEGEQGAEGCGDPLEDHRVAELPEVVEQEHEQQQQRKQELHEELGLGPAHQRREALGLREVDVELEDGEEREELDELRRPGRSIVTSRLP